VAQKTERLSVLVIRPPELPFDDACTGMARILAATLERLGHSQPMKPVFPLYARTRP